MDDWHTPGIRATGSKTARCKDVFVPAYRVVSMYVARDGRSWPGLEVHRSPHCRIPHLGARRTLHRRLHGGNACAALEITIDLVKSRSTNYTAPGCAVRWR